MTTTDTDGLTGHCRYERDHPDDNPGLYHRACPGNQDIRLPHQRAAEPPAMRLRCSCACHLQRVPPRA